MYIANICIECTHPCKCKHTDCGHTDRSIEWSIVFFLSPAEREYRSKKKKICLSFLFSIVNKPVREIAMTTYGLAHWNFVGIEMWFVVIVFRFSIFSLTRLTYSSFIKWFNGIFTFILFMAPKLKVDACVCVCAFWCLYLCIDAFVSNIRVDGTTLGSLICDSLWIANSFALCSCFYSFRILLSNP